MRRLAPAAALALLLVATPPARSAGRYYIALDAPALLSGADRTTSQIVRVDAGAYQLEASLPADAPLAALHRRADGSWLLALAAAATLGGTTFEPRDVLAHDGTASTMLLDGSDAGIPAGAQIDAIATDAAGALVLSFDVAVDLGGVTYDASDLVRRSGSAFTTYWVASAAGVPASSNVAGAAVDLSGKLVITFDVPTLIWTSEYLPGELVAVSAGAFSSYAKDPAWPPSASLHDVALTPQPGAVPDGAGVPGTPMKVTRSAGSLSFTWAPSCAGSTGASDYEVYEGDLATMYSHAPALCSTGGATAATLPVPAGSRYYLVVPRNAMVEGSYGTASSSVPRPPAAAACLPSEPTACP